MGVDSPRIVLIDLDFGSVFTALIDVGGDDFKGSVQVVDGDGAAAAARAVLAALEGVIPVGVKLNLALIDTRDPGADIPPIVTAVVTMHVDGLPTLPYVGSAFDREGVEWAAARAVLAAIARRLQIMIFSSQV